MKKHFFIILLGIPALLLSCNQAEEEKQEQYVTKDLPMRWTTWPCTVNDEMGLPIAEGVKCKYHQLGGCKWPTKCKKITRSFMLFAIENTPGLSESNWADESIPLTDYDVLLELWRENPIDHYHPDSIPPDTIQ